MRDTRRHIQRDPPGSPRKAERRQRRVSGAVLIWDNRETQTVDLEKVEAQVFELMSGSRRAESRPARW